MANAQFWVTFVVTVQDRTYNEFVSLASPDLRNTKEARRRAIKTAEIRVRRRIDKKFKLGPARRAKFRCTDCRCVG